jgi:hypothetical protein
MIKVFQAFYHLVAKSARATAPFAGGKESRQSLNPTVHQYLQPAAL